ncbi:MAG: hypothetical protein O3A78_05105 [Nitrospinae bacterium]|jgi:hypothetical protein|nr:hypothetical protein [Nitrospinota bacterium]
MRLDFMFVSVRTSDLQPGMVVARDVKDLHGRLLVPAGAKTSAKHLNVLKIWGVSEVFINGDSKLEKKADPLDALDPRQRKQIEEEMQTLFCRHDLNDPVIKELMDICIHRKLNTSLK